MKKIIKFLFLFTLLSSTVLMTCATFYYIDIKKDLKNIELVELYQPKTSQIFDMNNEVIKEIGIKKQEWVNYEDISPNMINALIAIEDERFFSHNGVDYKRMLGALLNNIKSLKIKEGASTINQQLIKNVYLTNEKSLNRKITEIILATKLDKELSKNQILEAYLNNILFGDNIYGIKKASFYYFNKEPIHLSISEAAMLAGIIQLPNHYNPYKNIENATKRRNIVLKRMKELNYISDLEYEVSLNTNIIDQLDMGINYVPFNTSMSFVDYILKESIDKHNINPLLGGRKIYTSYNPLIQEEIARIFDNSLGFFPDDHMKCGLVIINNDNGEILGLGGSRLMDNIGINYASDVKLQPGSTIKPILDYGPAFEFLNYGTGTIIKDEAMTYQNGESVKNWDSKYKGNITIREALTQSRNIPSIKLFNTVGHEKAFSFAKRIGIHPDGSIFEANAIGGFNQGYTVIEMANAYQAFANEGTYIESHAIRKIEGKEEITPFYPSNVAMKKTTSYMINSILHDVISYSLATIDNMYLMGKTGQTNYDYNTCIKYNIPLNSTKDSWFIGYNDEITIACWVGYDDLNYYMDSQKKDVSKRIFLHLMQKFGHKGGNTYSLPEELVQLTIEKGHEKAYLANSMSPFASLRNEYFITGFEPFDYYSQ